jgi:hypothetical protein
MVIEKTPNISFKIVGLITSVLTILACFVAIVFWISTNMADNSVSIRTLQEQAQRHEILISKNSEILLQHAQLIAIIDQHESSLNILTNFMTQGGRFTDEDGKALHDELQTVKDRLQHYEILETELAWIKKSIANLEKDLENNFDKLSKQLESLAVR